MSVKKYLLRLERMHQLISRGATGTPEQFARKLNINRSMLYKYLSVMKDLGAPVAYDRFSESYYYTERVEFSPYFLRNQTK